MAVKASSNGHFDIAPEPGQGVNQTSVASHVGPNSASPNALHLSANMDDRTEEMTAGSGSAVEAVATVSFTHQHGDPPTAVVAEQRQSTSLADLSVIAETQESVVDRLADPQDSLIDASTSHAPSSRDVPTKAVTSTNIPGPEDVNYDHRTTAVDGDVKMEMEEEGAEEYGDEDGGVIRCICECDEDDGFTIQCDQCLVWQHCACFGMSQASVPEEYRCEQCDPRPVDVAFAKAHQQRRKDAEVRKDMFEQTVRRQTQVPAIDRRQGDEADERTDTREENQVIEDTQTQSGGQITSGISRSRKPSQHLDLSNIKFQGEESPISSTPGSVKTHRKKVSTKTGPKRNSESVTTPRSAFGLREASTPGVQTSFRDDQFENEFDSPDRIEAWHVEYTPIRSNLTDRVGDKLAFKSLMNDYSQGSPLKALPGSGTRLIAPVVGKKVKTIAGPISTDATRKVEEGEEAEAVTASQDPSVEFALSATGNECLPVEINAPSLSSVTQKTYVRQISELASSSIFNSLVQMNITASEPQRSSSASRMFSKPVMHGLFADASIPAGCFIMEFQGEVLSADTYRDDPINQYKMIGVTKTSVHLLPPPLNLCLDGRRFGNKARFARFSCHPNSVLRPILLRRNGLVDHVSEQQDRTEDFAASKASSPLNGDNEETEIAFGIFSIADIPKTHEITLGWEWDDQHIVHLLPQLARNPMLGVLDMHDAASLSTSNPRSWDRETRNAAITTLVEKGEFPYADTEFSAKMNSIMTVLLSSCLCACIGSAAAPNTGGSASSNNVKRQDCAIVQMLRLSQGMGLLNVNLPTAKSSRKSRAPDFGPLVGKRRWWRPDNMPLTPPVTAEETLEEQWLRRLSVPIKLAPGGKIGRVYDTDLEKALLAERLGNVKDLLEQEDATDDDSASLASSATEPLDVDSADEHVERGMMRLDGDGVMITRHGDRSYLVHTALPPKKRISGTRLKAISPGVDDWDVEYRGKKRQRALSDLSNTAKIHRAARSKAKMHSIGEFDSDDGRVETRRAMSSNKRSKITDPSSPLSTAPSEDEDDTSVSISEELNVHRRKRREGSAGGVEADISKRSSKSRLTKSNKHRRSKPKASKAMARRRELLGDLLEDTQSSDGEDVEDIDLGDDARASMSLSKSSRTSKRKKAKKLSESDEGADVDEATGSVRSMRSATPMVDVQTHTSPQQQQSPPVDSFNIKSETEPHLIPSVGVPPPIEVPKAKLSLADYKKRLAERRTSSQPGMMTPLATSSLPTGASPEKPSLPGTPMDTPTPGSASGMYGGFHFPMPVSVSSTSTEAVPTLTPTSSKTEFIAPPAPRLPPLQTVNSPSRASVPPSPHPPQGHIPSSGGAPTQPFTPARFPPPPSPNDATSASGHPLTPRPAGALTQTPPPPPPPPAPPTAPYAHGSHPPLSPSASGLRSASQISNSGHTDSRPEVVDAEVRSDATPSRSSSFGQIHSSTFHTNRGPPPPAPPPIVGHSSGTKLPFGSRLPEQHGDAQASPSGSSTFNPPRGPKALINGSSFNGGGGNVSAAAAPTVGVTSQAYPAGGVRSRGPSFGEGSIPASTVTAPSPRNISPTRPSYGSTAGFGVNATTAASLGDFANVPKGPARMREREMLRDRDRSDWDRDRERDWERERERERDRDRDRERDRDRDVGSQMGPPGREYRDQRLLSRTEWDRDREPSYGERDYSASRIDDRNLRDHHYDRSRRLDDDRFALPTGPPSARPATSGVPPPHYGAHYAGAPGSYPPPPPPPPPSLRGSIPPRGSSFGRGGGASWSGRARTRGRGSRGGPWR